MAEAIITDILPQLPDRHLTLKKNYMKPLSIIVAFADDQAIGLSGSMPWHLPEDLKHFKEVTMGQPVIMGRRTWESLPKRPLPGRVNIVVTSSLKPADGMLVAASPEEAVNLCPEGSEPFIIGGATLYKYFLPLVKKLYITRIYRKVEADTWFPPINPDDWLLVGQQDHVSSGGLDYAFQLFERKL